MILVDANVLIDLFTDDPEWSDWSRAALLDAAGRGQLGINPIILQRILGAALQPRRTAEFATGRS